MYYCVILGVMDDLKKYMEKNRILKIKIDYDSLDKTQLLVYNTCNQIIITTSAITYFTDNFMESFNKIVPFVLPQGIYKDNSQKIINLTLEIRDFISCEDGFVKSIAILINIMEHLIKLIDKIKQYYGEFNVITQQMHIYKIFTEINLKTLTILLDNISGDKEFKESRKFVNRIVSKYFKISNNPHELLNIFAEMVAVITSLSKATAEGGWNLLKEEVFKHGGILDEEEPTC